MATITVGETFAFDQSKLELVSVLSSAVNARSSTYLSVSSVFGFTYDFSGSGVAYDTNGLPVSGVINELKILQADGSLAVDFSNLSLPAATFVSALESDITGRAAYNLLVKGDDTFIGGPLADAFGGGGTSANLVVKGGGGNDRFTGDFGSANTLVLTGKQTDYTITLDESSAGAFTVTDNRPGSPDGTDYVYLFNKIQFADGTLPFLSTTGYTVYYELLNVLRVDPETESGFLSSYTSDLQFGRPTSAQVVNQIALLADGTTSVATMSYQFFTGATPTPSGLNYLVSPTGGNADNLNSAYYGAFSTTNRYINFASNLGKLGAGAAAFQAAYGGLSLADATSKAYAAIFGSTPTADKVAHLLNDLVPNGAGGSYARENYFAYYGGDGLGGIGTKAAMVGWLISQADSAHVGTLETADMAYLQDLAAGKITGSVDLIGVYHGTAYTGG